MDLRVRRDHVPYDLWEKQAFLKPQREMSSITDTLKSSSKDSANVSTSGRLHLTAGSRADGSESGRHGFYHCSLRTGIQRYVATYQRTDEADAGKAYRPRRLPGAPLDDGQHLHPTDPAGNIKADKENPQKRLMEQSP